MIEFKLKVYYCVSHRDGGLKRAKVKDSLKEQQQKKYSHMVVGDDSSDWTQTPMIKDPIMSACWQKHRRAYLFYGC